MSRDEFGNRMKQYEGAETQRMLMPLLPVCVRIDGRGFSRYTRDLPRPYDERLSHCMIETTRFLVQESSACVGYTQSDEISLVLHTTDPKTQLFFNGKVQKLVSVLASAATIKFAALVRELLPEKADELAMFDCRVWNVPNLEEAANVLLWRELDATRNSLQSAAGTYFSHSELHNKTQSDMHEMLFQQGINWNEYPTYFKRGTYLQRRKVERPLTDEERLAIPEGYRPEPGEMLERTDIITLELPPLRKVMNRVDVLFEGAEVQVGETDELAYSND